MALKPGVGPVHGSRKVLNIWRGGQEGREYGEGDGVQELLACS